MSMDAIARKKATEADKLVDLARSEALAKALECRGEAVPAEKKVLSPDAVLTQRLVDAVYNTPDDWKRLTIEAYRWRRNYEYVKVWCLFINEDDRETVHRRYLAVWCYNWRTVVVGGVYTSVPKARTAQRWCDDLTYLRWRYAWAVKKALKKLPALKAVVEMEKKNG